MEHLLLGGVHDGTAALTTRQDYFPPDRTYEERQHYYYYYAYDEQQQTHHNPGFVDWCWRILVRVLKLIALGILSMGSYAILYQFNQPKLFHFQAFHFDYYQQPSPSATVKLQSKPYQWTSLLDDVESSQLSIPEPRILKPRQSYFVEVTLHLPESPRNLDSGMFGIETELYGASNETTRLLATSRRSLRFPYRSSWVRAIANLVALPSLLLHAMEEVQTVKNNVFRYVKESELYALHVIHLRLLEDIEVVAAELRVGAELTPFQEMIKTWFWSCFLVGSILFAVFYFCLYQLVQRWLAKLDEPPCELNFDEFSVRNASLGLDGPTSNNTFTESRRREVRQNLNSETTHDRPRRATRLPAEEVHIIPDSFADGSDGDWEDLTIIGNETETIRSETSRQRGRCMTSDDLRRYLSPGNETNPVHPFLVFMDH